MAALSLHRTGANSEMLGPELIEVWVRRDGRSQAVKWKGDRAPPGGRVRG